MVMAVRTLNHCSQFKNISCKGIFHFILRADVLILKQCVLTVGAVLL